MSRGSSATRCSSCWCGRWAAPSRSSAAFVWAELASRFPHVGGQYVYLQRAYPPVVGFLYGVALLFIINGGSLAAVSILFASYVDRSFVPLGAAGIRVGAALALVGLTAVNALGVRAGKWTNNLLMAREGGRHAGARRARVRPRRAAGEPLRSAPAVGVRQRSVHVLFTALVPILFAYGGWQSCANHRGGDQRSRRGTLPRPMCSA